LKTLIWSVAWGDYRYMLQSLMKSIRDVGVEHDILTFTDQPLTGVVSCKTDERIELDFKQYWKFHYLNKLKSLEYDLFVFIDSDHYFVRKPEKDFSDIVGDDPWHSFLESPINSPRTRRGDWWGVPNDAMVELYRGFGVNQGTVYSTNGGFWMCRREFMAHAAETGLLFRDYQKNKGLDLPEEVAISVLSHMFSMDYESRFHYRYMDTWASEWTGVLKDRIPDGSFWDFQEYMTMETKSVNPAIVHAMRSKSALVESGKQIMVKNPPSDFVAWENASSALAGV